MNKLRMKRPKSVLMFELFFFLFLGIGILSASITWVFNIFAYEGTVEDIFTLATIHGLILFFILALVLLASRKSSNIARWLLLVSSVMWAICDIPSGGMLNTSIPAFIHSNTGKYGFHPLYGSISVIQFTIQIVAFFFIFRPDTKAWFHKESIG